MPIKEAKAKAKAKAILERDEAQKQLDNMIDMAAHDRAAAKALAPKVSGLQAQIDKLEGELAELEGKSAAAEVSNQEIDFVMDTPRKGVADIQNQSWEKQKAILEGIVRRVGLEAGKPLRLSLAVPLALTSGSYERTTLAPRGGWSTNCLCRVGIPIYAISGESGEMAAGPALTWFTDRGLAPKVSYREP